MALVLFVYTYMPNILNLRKEPKPLIIEKVIQEKRVWWLELLKMVTIITVVSSVVFGISKAADLSPSQLPAQNFSALGTVSDISTTSLSINNAHSSDVNGNTSYTFDLTNVKKVENKKYVQLLISDINIGDKIVVQGVEKGGVIDIRRIISFSSSATTSNVIDATSTATSTTATSTTATTTDTIATTTATSTLATSTDTTATTTSDVASSTIASTTISAATSTATSTETIATTTATTTAEVTSTSTPDQTQSTTTPPSDATSTPTPVPVVTPPAPVTPPSDSATSADSSSTNSSTTTP